MSQLLIEITIGNQYGWENGQNGTIPIKANIAVNEISRDNRISSCPRGELKQLTKSLKNAKFKFHYLNI